jgi:hypothetical protein
MGGVLAALGGFSALLSGCLNFLNLAFKIFFGISNFSVPSSYVACLICFLTVSVSQEFGNIFWALWVFGGRMLEMKPRNLRILGKWPTM